MQESKEMESQMQEHQTKILESIQGSKFTTVSFSILNSLTHLLLGAVVFITCIYGYQLPSANYHRYHIIFCTIGYILLMAQGILALHKSNGWSSPLTYYQKHISHRVVTVVGAAFACVGSILRIQLSNRHFATPHGICAWLALIFTFITLLVGVLSLYINKPKVIRLMHIFLGCTTFSCALVCLCYGFDKNGFRNWIDSTTANLLISCSAVGGFGVVLTPCIGFVRRIS